MPTRPRKQGKRKQFGKWWRREPRDLVGFYKKYPNALRDSILDYPYLLRGKEYIHDNLYASELFQARPPGGYQSPHREEVYQMAKTANNAMGFIERLVPPASQGTGHHFVFPMTAAAGVGEFMKGALHVLAPRARVTFLVTPQSAVMQVPPGTVAEYVPTIQQHLRRTSAAGAKKIVVVDYFRSGTTLVGIRKALEGLGFRGEISHVDSLAIHDFIDRFLPRGTGPETGNLIPTDTLGWGKDKSGARLFGYPRHTDYGGYQKQKRARRLLYDLGIAVARSYQRLHGQPK